MDKSYMCDYAKILDHPHVERATIPIRGEFPLQEQAGEYEAVLFQDDDGTFLWWGGIPKSSNLTEILLPGVEHLPAFSAGREDSKELALKACQMATKFAFESSYFDPLEMPGGTLFWTWRGQDGVLNQGYSSRPDFHDHESHPINLASSALDQGRAAITMNDLARS